MSEFTNTGLRPWAGVPNSDVPPRQVGGRGHWDFTLESEGSAYIAHGRGRR